MSNKITKGRKKRGSPTRIVAKAPKHVNLDLFGIEERMKSHAEHKRCHPELYARQAGEKEAAYEQYLTSAEEGNGAVYYNQIIPKRVPRARPVVNVNDPLLPGYLSERNKQAAERAKEQAKAYSSNHEEKLWWDWSKKKAQASEVTARAQSPSPVGGSNDSGESFLPQITTSPMKVQRPMPSPHGQSLSPAQARLIDEASNVQMTTSKSPRATHAPKKEGTREQPQYRVGQRVQVKFAVNGGTYPATVVAVDQGGGRGGNSAYDVQYEDGQVDQGVEPQHIALRPPTPDQPAPPPPIAGKARYASPGADSGGSSSNGSNNSFSKGKVVEGLHGEGEEATWCPAKVVDEVGNNALVVKFLDSTQETVLLPLHRVRPNPVVARRQQRAAVAAAAKAGEGNATSLGEDPHGDGSDVNDDDVGYGGKRYDGQSQARAAASPSNLQASSNRQGPQNVGADPFKSTAKKKTKTGKKGRGPQGAKSIDEPRAVGFATRGQDLKSAVAARAEVRRANAKQRALQRENKAHQVDFAELKAAAYAAAKNRRQNHPQQQQQERQTQQQQSLVSSGPHRRSGGEGAALQPVIMEYDQVDMAPSSNYNHNRRGGAAAAPKDNRSYSDKVQDRNRRELRLRILQNQF